jgi:large subunit ribosomal protein L32e
MIKKFLRQETRKHSKIGKGRKKLQKWRKPKGRDSKMRLSMKGHPRTVSIGYKSPKKIAGKIKGKLPKLIRNLKDLERLNKENIAILAKIGARKKLELIKMARERNIEILNIKEDK